ncbi:hypothetical protein Hypma_005788 [Hypsizygus marmoreus]|uniref:Uncharacterized protein n=1 Tax=Hypsizygus marmoreus TaxID=39966 RepID=A0A369KDC0_HYPMA|nr:hypothetical protein Hypma_005788 [Hypsizygus marmoreus]
MPSNLLSPSRTLKEVTSRPEAEGKTDIGPCRSNVLCCSNPKFRNANMWWMTGVTDESDSKSHTLYPEPYL